MKKTASLLILVLGILCFAGCDSEGGKTSSDIDAVKNGYMGGCFEATLAQVFEGAMPGGEWDGGETDDGERIVEYKVDENGAQTRIQFTLTDDNHFTASAIKVGDSSPQNDETAAQYIYGKYISYFAYKYPDKVAADFMADEAQTDILKGLTAEYAKKAKNPVDIGEYLDKSANDLKAVLEIKDDGALSYSGDGFTVVFDDSGIDHVILTDTRVATLFGINAHMSYKTAASKIADEFTYATEEAGAGGTYTASFRKNGTDDMLAIDYDTDSEYVTVVTYIKDGLAGY